MLALVAMPFRSVPISLLTVVHQPVAEKIAVRIHLVHKNGKGVAKSAVAGFSDKWAFVTPTDVNGWATAHVPAGNYTITTKEWVNGGEAAKKAPKLKVTISATHHPDLTLKLPN